MNSLLAGLFNDWTDGRRHAGACLYGVAAAPCALIYRAGTVVDTWIRPRRRLAGPVNTRLLVVSSPLVGGAGKTPLAACLAADIARRGKRVAIVTLGYRRQRSGTHMVDMSDRADPAAVGDEAIELHQVTGLPVYVGDEPADVVDELDRRGNVDVIVFDDGIRRRWAGERRIVVMPDRDLARPIRYLPYGRWRVSPRDLPPAHGAAVTLSAESGPIDGDRHRRRLVQWGFTGPVAWYRVGVDGFSRLGAGTDDPAGPPPNKPALVFCGLGMPSRFLRQVRAVGVSVAGFVRFPDHHHYQPSDLANLEKMCRERGCSWLLASRKDAVKIDQDWAPTTPLYFMRISLQQVAGDDLAAATVAGGLTP